MKEVRKDASLNKGKSSAGRVPELGDMHPMQEGPQKEASRSIRRQGSRRKMGKNLHCDFCRKEW